MNEEITVEIEEKFCFAQQEHFSPHMHDESDVDIEFQGDDGVPKRPQPKSSCDTSQFASNLNGRNVPTVEKNVIKSLEAYEQKIIDNIQTIEDELILSCDGDDQILAEQKRVITTSFDKLILELMQRKHDLLEQTKASRPPRAHELPSGETLIGEDTILTADKVHRLGSVRILKNVTLTVNEWNELSNKGGKLLIECESLVLETGAKIDVTAKGYKGGQKIGMQGYSVVSDEYFSSGPRESRCPNVGGGGSLAGWGGAGGGYGTKGSKGVGFESFYQANGGDIYGDDLLSTLHLGSGGGGGGGHEFSTKGARDINHDIGASGGGAIRIVCRSHMIINKGSKILANGGTASNQFTGCGSGGSIHLSCPSVVNEGAILAKGGNNAYGSGNGWGLGGSGRIRIDCSKELKATLSKSKIKPKVGFFGTFN